MNTPELPQSPPAVLPLQATPTLPQPIHQTTPTTPIQPDTGIADASTVPAVDLNGLDFAAASQMGSYHNENEDSYTTKPPQPLWLAVVDGVGGGALGKLASQTLLAELAELDPADLPDAEHRRAWLHRADTRVAMALAERTRQPGAATFVAAWPEARGKGRKKQQGQDWQWWQLTWAGDCRAYRLSARGDLHLLTRDDTYGNLNETPPAGGGSDDPARMVGSGAVDEANHARIRLKAGELLFLCSDGLHKHVPPDQLASVLREPGGSLGERCTRLCRMAHQNGGKDDATIVVVQRQPSRLALLWKGLLLGLLLGVLMMGYRFYSQPRPVSRPVPVVVPATPPLPAGMAADAVTASPVMPAQQGTAPAPGVTSSVVSARPSPSSGHVAPAVAPAPAGADHLRPPPVRVIVPNKPVNAAKASKEGAQ